jgi:hypothetical protein
VAKERVGPRPTTRTKAWRRERRAPACGMQHGGTVEWQRALSFSATRCGACPRRASATLTGRLLRVWQAGDWVNGRASPSPPSQAQALERESRHAELPKGWEVQAAEDGRYYYLDHNTRVRAPHNLGFDSVHMPPARSATVAIAACVAGANKLLVADHTVACASRLCCKTEPTADGDGSRRRWRR